MMAAFVMIVITVTYGLLALSKEDRWSVKTEVL